MSLIDIRSVKITNKGQIAIPRGVREMKGFKTGERLAVLSFDDHIELRPIKQIDESMNTAIATEKVLSKDWNSNEEEEAWKNL